MKKTMQRKTKTLKRVSNWLLELRNYKGFLKSEYEIEKDYRGFFGKNKLD